MSRLIKIVSTGIFVLLSFFGIAQTAIKALQTKADNAFERKDYTAAFDLYKQAKEKTTVKDSTYSDILYSYASCIYYLEIAAREKEDFMRSADLAKHLLDVVENEKSYLDAATIDKKYTEYQNLV